MMRCLRALALLVATASLGAQAVTMTIAYEDKAQPPHYLGNSREIPQTHPGVAVEMIQAIPTMVPNLKINLTRAPWKRCTTELGTGAYDGIFNASYLPERLAIGWYPTKDGTHKGPVDLSKRITTISYALYVPKGSTLAWDGKAFRNLSGLLGAPLGYSIVKDLQALGVTVHEVPGTRNALDMVIGSRISGAALQEVSADALIQQFPDLYGTLRKFEKPLASKAYYLMLSNRFVAAHPELAKQIWAAIRMIRERDYERLVGNYRE
jgi:polar amino acid transport system substrate-binding protein